MCVEDREVLGLMVGGGGVCENCDDLGFMAGLRFERKFPVGHTE